MTKRLDGTVALVNGASSGIGEATGCALAAQGATLAVAARRKDRLDHLAASTGEAAVERTVAEFGRLDTGLPALTQRKRARKASKWLFVASFEMRACGAPS
jgi:NADP-dependent 3-hydroxy acid dehydrogenase YdfG